MLVETIAGRNLPTAHPGNVEPALAPDAGRDAITRFLVGMPSEAEEEDPC
jgi:hypothetical protein